MILAASIVVPVLPALYTWWRFAGWFAWTKAEDDVNHRRYAGNKSYHYARTNTSWTPSPDMWGGAYCLGFLVGIAWPLLLSALAFKKLSRVRHGGISYVPKPTRERLYRERINELEREVLGR